MKRYKTLSVIILAASLVMSGCSGYVATLDNAVNGLFHLPSLLNSDEQVDVTPTPKPTTAPPAAIAIENLDDLQNVYSEVYDKVIPSVVNIQVVQHSQVSTEDNQIIPGFPIFPFENLPNMSEPESSALGSGFVWDKEGHIITNNHVAADADEITITFNDGSSVPGELVGTDPESELAVIKVDLPAERLHPVEIADSTTVKVGHIAIAIGNPFGLDGTMTTGIVSALGRSLPVEDSSMGTSTYTIPDVIQTDAPINPGNSGGVLVDIQGRLIGVPTAIESPVRANAGIGFAVPSVIVEKVVPELIEKGYYEHPWMGLSGMTLTSDLAKSMDLKDNQHGALVIEVTAGSPADDAGLKGSSREVEINGEQYRSGGDVIIAINDSPVEDFEDLVAYLVRYTEVDQTIKVTVLRDGKEKVLDLTLAARPKNQQEEPQLVKDNSQKSQVWLGISGLSLSPALAEAAGLDSDQQGVLIQQVVKDSPADEAKLQGSSKSLTVEGQKIMIGGDIITAIEGEKVGDITELKALLQEYEAGDEVSITVLRDGKKKEIDLTLGTMPDINQ